MLFNGLSHPVQAQTQLRRGVAVRESRKSKKRGKTRLRHAGGGARTDRVDEIRGREARKATVFASASASASASAMARDCNVAISLLF